MTLQCKCGGAVRVKCGYKDKHGTIHETYECQACGRRGGYQSGSGAESTTGCVKIEG